ncbi:MAG: PorT family protein [Bacteroides sp.]|nr:PorT family protein [Bacteroides sp.]
MKNSVKIIALACMLIMGISASAQDSSLSFGLKAGMNLSNMSGDFDDMDAKIGYNVGITVDYGFTENWYLLSGLELTAKGAKFDEGGYELKFNPLFLQLPLHAAYKFPVGDNLKIVVNAGPYLAYGIGGKIKENDGGDKEDWDFFGSEDDGGCKRFDFGLGVGGGVEFGKFKVGIGYDFGLTDLGRDVEIKTRNGYLTVGYKF